MKTIFLIVVFMMMGCSKKSEPLINKDANLSTPVLCMSLNEMMIDKAFIKKLHALYTFDKNCDLKLSIKYKKDIVCNSPYNANGKSVSQLPKSFLKLELKRGLKVVYSYYIDLYDNVDKEDIEDAFMRVKKDLIEDSLRNLG